MKNTLDYATPAASKASFSKKASFGKLTWPVIVSIVQHLFVFGL